MIRGEPGPRPPLLLLDAGNTVVFLDHQAIAEVAEAQGIVVGAEALRRVEGAAKRHYEQHLREGGSHEDGWGQYLVTVLREAGVARDTARALVPHLRAAHDAFNLWRRVPEGLPEALLRLRAAGTRLAIVSNSEGMLPALFERVGLGAHFELVVDSHHEGVRKPDPEIFRRALTRLGVAASDALYVGDIPSVDVDGARAAGMRAVLVDALGFYADYDGAPVVDQVTSLIARWV